MIRLLMTVQIPSVAIERITKRFGEVTAVDRVSLEVRSGELFSLLGPSGCGKTTLLRLVGGLEEPDAGAIRIHGRDVTGVPAHRRPSNMVFQHYALFPHLTVAENVAFGLRYQKARAGSAEAARVRDVLALVRLTGLEARRPDQLSGGQRQRVALARALVLEPEVLLLDEPLAALDPALRREVQGEIKSLQRTLGITFLLVTHDREEALALSDRLAVMNQGHIEQVGSPAEVFERPATEFVARFTGASNVFEREGKRFVVRPEKLRLRKAPEGGMESLSVLVEDWLYQGVSTLWTVRDERGERFTVYEQNDRPAGEAAPFEPGDAAWLVWDTRHVVPLELEAQSPRS
jgi:ABC-type Fe3+/spermidine/putrescine transport system ATPase subunit